jgi:hypothetical protein
MTWIIVAENEDGSNLYGRIDQDGLMRVTAIEGYPELDKWLAEGNTPEPADPEPAKSYSCSAWQIRKALNNQNLRQAVEDAVLASTDQDLKDGWNFAGSFDSNNPFVLAMGQAIGKSEQETIDLIQYASTL